MFPACAQPIFRKVSAALLAGLSACVVWSSATIFTGGHPDLSPFSLMIRSASQECSFDCCAAKGFFGLPVLVAFHLCALQEMPASKDSTYTRGIPHFVWSTSCQPDNQHQLQARYPQHRVGAYCCLLSLLLTSLLSVLTCWLLLRRVLCRGAVGSDWGVQLLVMWPLAYICFCTYFALFRYCVGAAGCIILAFCQCSAWAGPAVNAVHGLGQLEGCSSDYHHRGLWVLGRGMIGQSSCACPPINAGCGMYGGARAPFTCHSTVPAHCRSLIMCCWWAGV